MIETEEKDHGMTLTDKLNFGKHINHITGDTYNFRNIKAAFTHLDKGMMKKLITSMIRPRLQYVALVSSSSSSSLSLTIHNFSLKMGLDRPWLFSTSPDLVPYLPLSPIHSYPP